MLATYIVTSGRVNLALGGVVITRLFSRSSAIALYVLRLAEAFNYSRGT